MKKRILSALLCLSCLTQIYAQPMIMQERRIYVLDLTASMEGRGNTQTDNIFRTVIEGLEQTIDNIEDPNTEIEIIPFTNKTFSHISGTIAAKDSLLNIIDKIHIQTGDTNIHGAWKEGLASLDSTKVNYMFLLTDGLHNNGPSKEELYNLLDEWESMSSNKYYFAFYWSLVKNAVDSEIVRIAEDNKRMWAVESLDVNASLIRSSLSVRKNVFYDNKVTLGFYSNTSNSKVGIGDIGLSVSIDDNPYYEIVDVQDKYKDLSDEDTFDTDSAGVYVARKQYYTFELTPKCDKSLIPLSYIVDLHLSHDSVNYPIVFMTPDEICLEIVNKGPSVATIADLEGNEIPSTVNLGTFFYNQPFQGIFKSLRWLLEPTLKIPPYKWFAPDDVYLSKGFKVSFNEEAQRSGASVKMYMLFDDPEDDCLVYENLDQTDAVAALAETTEVNYGIMVDEDAPDRIFTGSFVVVQQGLDSINGDEMTDELYVMSRWTLKYYVGYPLILWLLWILTPIIIIRLLWRRRSKSSKKRGKKKERKIKRMNKADSKNEKIDRAVMTKHTDVDGIFTIEKMLYQPSVSVTDKVNYLETIRIRLEEIKAVDMKKNQSVFESLRITTQGALDEANKLWDPAPKEGNKGNWIKPDFTYKLSAENPYYQACSELDFTSCHYDVHGSPDFTPVTVAGSVVEISVLYDQYSEDQLRARGGGGNIQDVAQAMMAENLSDVIVRWWNENFSDNNQFDLIDAFFKWRDVHDLVPHEDGDCRTMRLVARSAHKAFTHRGGIANAILIKKYFN